MTYVFCGRIFWYFSILLSNITIDSSSLNYLFIVTATLTATDRKANGFCKIYDSLGFWKFSYLPQTTQEIFFILIIFRFYWKYCIIIFSGGWSLVNWLSQTKRNLMKLKWDFLFMQKKLLFLALGLFPFHDCVPNPSLFDTNILQDGLLDLKFSTRLVTVDIFN